MYTLPPTMTPENAAIVNEYKRLIKNYYQQPQQQQNNDIDNDHEMIEDPVYQALIHGPDPESIRKNIQYVFNFCFKNSKKVEFLFFVKQIIIDNTTSIRYKT